MWTLPVTAFSHFTRGRWGEGVRGHERCVGMKETPSRRITVTSSFYEISTDQLWNKGGDEGLRGGVIPPAPFFSYSRLLDRLLKDDVKGFSFTSDIFFHGYREED
jgi:hypothetical protein